jgi:hypothetical protein
MYFTIIGTVSSIETIAAGSGIRERARLAKRYGRGRWLKREFKIKRLLEGNPT